MVDFTNSRDADTPDELWWLEHPSVYTLGQAGKTSHILNTMGIPVVQTDRGGQVTWHGPGQVVVYTLVDLRRKAFGVRGMVERLEAAVVETLAELGIEAAGRRDAPGVYVADEKIAALGLRVRKGSTYHGLALNVDSDTAPWAGINPCGYEGLGVTRVIDQLPQTTAPAPSPQTTSALAPQTASALAFDRNSTITTLLQALQTRLAS